MRPTATKTAIKQPSFIEAARREQIIGCAIETIATVGYAQASLAAIAQRAKISKGIISYYFSSKDDLIQQVVARIFAEAAEFMGSYANKPTAAEKLRAYIDANVAFLRSDRNRVVALVHIVTNARDSKGRPLLDAANYEPVIDALERILIQGQKKGEFRKFSPRVMAVSIRGAIDGIPGQMLIHPALDLEAYAKELVTLFERATRKGS